MTDSEVGGAAGPVTALAGRSSRIVAERLTRIRADPRRVLPFVVAVAWPLTVRDSLSLVERCETTVLRSDGGTCLASPRFLGEAGVHALRLVALAAVAATLLYVLLGPRLEHAFDDRLGRLLFGPARSTVAVVAALHVLAFALGGPLLHGQFVTERWLWYALAVAAWPLLGGAFIWMHAEVLFGAGVSAEPPLLVDLATSLFTLGLVVTTAALSAVWLYLLAGGVTRGGAMVRDRLADWRG